ncbi:SDR family NAD(P)-dependent oxidoreductase [Terracidiphilus gabretensis]|jgi:3-oxoacyl-[acyl-carrier protein] reductase|uniref:SDR family NAD(P)-dependent oxidoreductase n=1 Tax=Terracidiphilus gabretensis TaxID=1577687 RepID=UPI00071B4025|nr:SDR family oxidoreductase [Terracidiphilus gabretensis]
MRNVLVTGASRGLGLGIARLLTSAGYRVIGVARNDNSEFAEARAEAVNPGSFVFHCLDLAEIEKIPSFVSQLRKDHGPIYGLVNNAGISFEGALAMMPTAQIERLVRLNTLSPMVLTKYVVRSMMSQGEGRIVNLSSIIASTGYKGLSVYGATKSSLLGFSRSLAREVGEMGINVNSVAPGFVDTELTHSLDEESRNKIARRSALRRLTEVKDVANAVEYLLSDKAKNITGTVITVDAGSTA